MVKFFLILVVSFYSNFSLAANDNSTILSEDSISIINQSQNLSSMMKQLTNNGMELDVMNSLTQLAGSVSDYLSFISDFIYIQNNMIDAKDKLIVSKIIKMNRKNYLKMCEINLDTINKSLVYIKNSAALNQSMIIRDSVSKGCADLKNL